MELTYIIYIEIENNKYNMIRLAPPINTNCGVLVQVLFHRITQ